MKNWTPRQALLAGVVLIVVSNAIALLGVVWNRSGDPESTLRLSQRELLPPGWRAARDNSGIALRLSWRTLPRQETSTRDRHPEYYHDQYRTPEWLDRAKLENLGIDTAALLADAESGRTYRHREQSRAVLLVLEQDGPSYQKQLTRFREHLASENAKLAAKPDDAEFQRRARSAQDLLTREEKDGSRLFVVDAGLSLDALRARYPDRQQYAIVRGRIQPWVASDGKTRRLEARIVGPLVDALHVPHAERAPFERPNTPGKPAAFTAVVAFGQRQEPWIKEISLPQANSR